MTNGQINKNLAKLYVKEAEKEANKIVEGNNNDYLSFKECITYEIIYNQYDKIENTVKNISEFLCTLLLVSQTLLNYMV